MPRHVDALAAQPEGLGALGPLVQAPEEVLGRLGAGALELVRGQVDREVQVDLGRVTVQRLACSSNASRLHVLVEQEVAEALVERRRAEELLALG